MVSASAFVVLSSSIRSASRRASEKPKEASSSTGERSARAQGAASPLGGVAEQPGPLDVLPGGGRAVVLLPQDPLLLERVGDELQREVAGAMASHEREGSYRAAPPGGEVATGPLSV